MAGGQGVAGSNPAVPTQVRGLIQNLGSALGTTSIFLRRFWRILTAGYCGTTTEQRTVWNLTGLLERGLVEPLSPDYGKLIEQARARLRDEE